MAKVGQEMTATIPASGIGSPFVDGVRASPFFPRPPQVSAPCVCEHVDFQASTGSVSPNNKGVFEIALDGDVLKNLGLTLRLDYLPIAGLSGGTASLIRYVDLVGLACWSEITLKYGTERIQTIKPEEIYCKLMSMYSDEKKAQLYRLLGGGTAAQRSERAQNDPNQFVHIPFLTLLGNHLEGDPSQALFVRGLGERLKVEIQFTPAYQWVESDATTSYKIGADTTTTYATGASAASTAAFVKSYALSCEFYHVYPEERAQLAAIAKGSRRMLIQDYQYR